MLLILFIHVTLETHPYGQLRIVLDSGLRFFFSFQIQQIILLEKE